MDPERGTDSCKLKCLWSPQPRGEIEQILQIHEAPETPASPGGEGTGCHVNVRQGEGIRLEFRECCSKETVFEVVGYTDVISGRGGKLVLVSHEAWGVRRTWRHKAEKKNSLNLEEE